MCNILMWRHCDLLRYIIEGAFCLVTDGLLQVLYSYSFFLTFPVLLWVHSVRIQVVESKTTEAYSFTCAIYKIYACHNKINLELCRYCFLTSRKQQNDLFTQILKNPPFMYFIHYLLKGALPLSILLLCFWVTVKKEDNC